MQQQRLEASQIRRLLHAPPPHLSRARASLVEQQLQQQQRLA